MNLIEQIFAVMQMDKNNQLKQSVILYGIYHNAGHNEKRALDSAFLCVCGWSLETLIHRAVNT